MTLRAMNKIIINERNQKLNFFYQTSQDLDNKINKMRHAMHTNHKWSMIMHQLNGHTKF